MDEVKTNELPEEVSIDSHILETSISRITGGSKLTENNKITYLKDAAENFPAWLEGIRSAEKFICIEMYIWEPKNYGEEVRDLLVEKLKEGVNVYLTYDWFGSLNAHIKGFFKPLKENGAQVFAFNKLNVFSGMGVLSRNHRKSIIIDGRKAYVSGLCMSSDWEGDPQKGIPPWRDSGLELEGPIVLEVLKAFKETWSDFPEAIFNEEPLPMRDLSQEESLSSARVVATSRFTANMVRLDLMAITFAQSSIWITDAYFMPTKMYLQLLMNAAKDGVDVRILVPRSSDIPWIASVSRTQYRDLLEAGVRIFEWNGSMIHSKTLVLDGKWGRVGSTNLNLSSWFANSELDIVLEGEEAVVPLVMAYLDDIKHSTEMVLSENRQAQLATERQKLTPAERRRFTNMQSKALVRQMAYLGKNIDEIFRGNAENQDVLDKVEFYSYLGISVFFLVLTILFFKFPDLIAYPIVFLLFIATVLTGYRAFQTFRLIKKDIANFDKENENKSESESGKKVTSDSTEIKYQVKDEDKFSEEQIKEAKTTSFKTETTKSNTEISGKEEENLKSNPTNNLSEKSKKENSDKATKIIDENKDELTQDKDTVSDDNKS